jgi:teichuronic acid biosynthesis glycosyltransferase TuaC
MQNAYHAPDRVAVVTTSYPSSAEDWVGHFVREEVLELVSAGLDVTVLTPRVGVSDEGVRVRSRRGEGAMSAFGSPGALARVMAFPPRALTAAVWAVEEARALRRGRFDRIIAHWAVPSAWPISLGDVGAKLEVVSHGGDVRMMMAMPAPMRAAIVSAIVARADVWRFVSRELLDELASATSNALAARLRAIAVVRAPALRMVDVSARARALRSELGAFDVSVGRLVPSKRVDRAIDRAASKRALLVVVGEGPERRKLERQAKRTLASVRFVGNVPRDEALAYLAAADTLVFASEAEGCSTVVREARALHTRVAFV